MKKLINIFCNYLISIYNSLILFYIFIRNKIYFTFYGKKTITKTVSGNDFDKARTSLNVDDKFMDLSKIKLNWHRLRREYNDKLKKECTQTKIQNLNEKITQINWAFDYLSNNVDVDIYDRENIKKYKIDFYNKISSAYLNNMGKYDSFKDERELFNFYQRIHISNKYVEKRVKDLTLVLKYDYALKKAKEKIKKIETIEKPDKKISEKSIDYKQQEKETKEFICGICSKMYKSKSNFITHCKSKKHIEKVKNNKLLDPIYDIVLSSEEMTGTNQKQRNAKVKDTKELINLNIDYSVKNMCKKNDKDPFISEHSIFRTCTICKKQFNSRKELIMHLKDCT